jgi:hypothetical protein
MVQRREQVGSQPPLRRIDRLEIALLHHRGEEFLGEILGIV